MRSTAAALGVLLAAVSSGASVSVSASAVSADPLAALAKVNGYFQSQFPIANNDWTGGVYMAGNMAHYAASKNASVLQYALDWGDSHGWKTAGYEGCHGVEGCPDNIAAGSSYVIPTSNLPLRVMYRRASGCVGPSTDRCLAITTGGALCVDKE